MSAQLFDVENIRGTDSMPRPKVRGPTCIMWVGRSIGVPLVNADRFPFLLHQHLGEVCGVLDIFLASPAAGGMADLLFYGAGGRVVDEGLWWSPVLATSGMHATGRLPLPFLSNHELRWHELTFRCTRHMDRLPQIPYTFLRRVQSLMDVWKKTPRNHRTHCDKVVS